MIVLSNVDVLSRPVAQVPAFLLSQVRHMNQASHQKQVILSKTKRLLTRKSGKSDINQVSGTVVRPTGDSHSHLLPLKALHARHTCVQITQLCEDVIRVHAPLHTKVSMAIQLDGHLRARDVTCRFECDNR